MSYCRNCGAEANPVAGTCAACGAQSDLGNRFCQNCGKATDPLAEMCVGCWAKLDQRETQQAIASAGKSKTVSILLAVFLGFVTWSYTYKKDSWKFWVGAAAFVMAVVFTVTGDAFPFGPALLTRLACFGVGIWAIIDTATRTDAWYRDYSRPSATGAASAPGMPGSPATFQ